MKTAIVTIKSKVEETFLKKLFKKAGIKVRFLTKAETEDRIFASLIDEGMKTEDVTDEEVMKVLKKK